MQAYGHPENLYLLNNNMITEECKQTWYMSLQIFLEQTIHQCLEEDILEMGGLKESRNEKSVDMRKLMFLKIFGWWILKLDCTLGLNNIFFPPTFFEVKWIFSDSNSIFLWHESKKLISKISVASNFTFSSYAWLCVFHCSHRLLCWIKSRVRDFLWKLLSFHILK